MTTSEALDTARGDSPLGTLTVIAWTIGPAGDVPATPFLMVYSLGDGRDGPEAGAAALRATLEDMDLPIGAAVVDLAEDRRAGVHLLVEARRAVLTLPFMSAQCPVPAEWEAAAHESGKVCLILPVTPWPLARPGEPVTEARLKVFVTDDEVVRNAAHLMVPVSRIRG
ncbi:DUF5949 family protein [Streptomyces sp. NPDC048717]|uniref:DUF5949 family protein n=1 Tax=Streptomyces sp. NPDC048717 TaxID=3154928 RepID=UPI00341FD2DD